MISGWRKHLLSAALPFVYVELSTEMGDEVTSKRPDEDFWAAQRTALQLPDTGFAVTTDIQRATHPPDKQDVATRLSLEVRRLAYHEDIVSRGPELVSARSFTSSTDSSAVSLRLTFSNASLVSRPGILVANSSICGDGSADSLALDALKNAPLEYAIDAEHVTVQCSSPDGLVRINGDHSSCFLYAEPSGLPAPPVSIRCNTTQRPA